MTSLPRLAARCALVLAALSGPLAFSAQVPVVSSVTAATVYLDRAVVTRTAAVELAAGEHELVFAGLPASLVDASLRVAARGTARASLLDVQARTEWLAATPHERVRALEAELKELQRGLRVLNDRVAVLDRQQALLAAIGTAATTPPGKDAAAAPRPGIDEWQKLLEFSTDGYTRIAGERQQVDRQREEQQEKITQVQRQLAELNAQGGRNVKHVAVRVAVAEPGQLLVALSYALPEANWSPAYDARYTAAERQVQLGYFGIVRQTTGEDWRGIELTLSTARPSLGGAAPELAPWIVDQRREEPVVLSTFEMAPARPRMAKVAAGAAADAAAPAPEERAAEPVVATVDQQATSATFRIPGRTDVPSDNAPHKVAIAQLPLAAAPSYAAAPKAVPAAFLRAKVKNASEYPLLAGPMAVYLDDTFVANSRVKTVMPAEEFDLALGADDGLRVERKLLNRFTEDLGLVRKEIRVNYDVLITVQNNKRTAEKLVVRDRLPVSRYEKIVVALDPASARLVKPDAEGGLEWTLELAPGEKRELPLKFSVTYPRDLAVTGLE